MQKNSLLGFFVSVLTLVAAPGCVISGTDNDDDDMGSGSTSGSASSASGGSEDPTDDSESSGEAESSGSGADGSSGGDSDPTEGGAGPEAGAWVYIDQGATENDCTFLENPSQGAGDFVVENPGDGTFRIVPGDDTDPFECDLSGGGNFECDERFVESITQPGVDASLEVLVSADGTTTTNAMDAVQRGRIVCEGADCGAAEALLGTTLPCSFVIPFTATR